MIWHRFVFPARTKQIVSHSIVCFLTSLIFTISEAIPTLAISLEENVCSDVLHADVACLNWCKEVEAAGQLDELSTVKEVNCRYALRKAEAKELKTKACNQSACIYRLERSRPNFFSDSGFQLQFRRSGSYVNATFTKVGILTDRSGRRTRFESYCGAGPQCDPWSYASGNYAKSSLTFLDEFVVVKLPNSASNNPVIGRNCFWFDGQRYCGQSGP